MDREIEKTLGYEEKFIVINKKRIAELKEKGSWGQDHAAILGLQSALHHFENACRAHDIRYDQKYIVCNQDEPYAQEILDIILGRKKSGPPTELLDALKALYNEAAPHLYRQKGEPRARQKTLKVALENAKEALSKYQYISEPCPECGGSGRVQYEDVSCPVAECSKCEPEPCMIPCPTPNCTNGKIGRWVKG